MLKWTLKSADFDIQGFKSANFKLRFGIVEYFCFRNFKLVKVVKSHLLSFPKIRLQFHISNKKLWIKSREKLEWTLFLSFFHIQETAATSKKIETA